MVNSFQWRDSSFYSLLFVVNLFIDHYQALAFCYNHYFWIIWIVIIISIHWWSVNMIFFYYNNFLTMFELSYRDMHKISNLCLIIVSSVELLKM